MGVNKYNSEGYYDPTPYVALTNVIKEEKAERKSAFKPLVYICSPYSGDTDTNVKKARYFSGNCYICCNATLILPAPDARIQQHINFLSTPSALP